MELTIGTATNKTDFAPTPEGLYVVQLKHVEKAESTFNPGTEHLKWIFTVRAVIDSNDDAAEDAVGEELWGFSSLGGTLRHKARKWAEALRGKPYAEGEAMAVSELIGCYAKATVVPHTKQDGSETTKIESLAPHKTTRRSKRAPEPAPEPVIEDDEDDDDLLF